MAAVHTPSPSLTKTHLHQGGGSCGHESDGSEEELNPEMDALFRKVMDSMPPYEGTDPNTSEEWYCKACSKYENEDGVHLRQCSRCKAVHYCSIDCQRDDRKEHVKECKEIYFFTAQTTRYGQEISNYHAIFADPTDPEQNENLFETTVGHFWGNLDARKYCRARHALAMELAYLAHEYEVRPLLEKVLNHRLELLRLSSGDNLGVRDEIPFTFLSLNRDDEAYAIIKHWTRRFFKEIPLEEIDDLHTTSSQGDWLYGTADKYEDVFETLNETDLSFVSLAHLAALCIIKLRLIAAHQAKMVQFEQFAKTKMGLSVGDSLDHIRSAVVGDDEFIARMEKQEEHVTKYFDLIKANNPTLLPSIINPAPLKSQPAPRYVHRGKPSEAWEVLMKCNRLFVRIPGVERRLQGMLGKKPSYDFITES